MTTHDQDLLLKVAKAMALEADRQMDSNGCIGLGIDEDYSDEESLKYLTDFYLAEGYGSINILEVARAALEAAGVGSRELTFGPDPMKIEKVFVGGRRVRLVDEDAARRIVGILAAIRHEQELLFRQIDETFDYHRLKEVDQLIEAMKGEAAGQGSDEGPAREAMDRVADDLGRGKTFLCAPGEVHFEGDPGTPWTVDLLDEEGRVACSAQVRPGEDAVFPPFKGTITGMRYTSPVLPLAATETALDLKL